MDHRVRLGTDAWLLRGISSIPGVLKLSRNRLSFVATGTGSAWKWQLRGLEKDAGNPGIANRIDAGEDVVVFDFPLETVRVEFPWFYFSGGLVILAGQFKYRFSFGRPANTPMPASRSNRLAGTSAMDEMQVIRTMRTSGKAWKAALARSAESGM